MENIQTAINVLETSIRALWESPEQWKRFLKTAAWLGKFEFQEQIMINAYRPNATACVERRAYQQHCRPTGAQLPPYGGRLPTGRLYLSP
jgi:hypothetical protein